MKWHDQLKFLFVFVLLAGVNCFATPVEAMKMYVSTPELSSEIEIEGVRALPEKLSQNGKEIPSAFERVKSLAEGERKGRIVGGYINIFLGIYIVISGRDLYERADNLSGEYAGAARILGLAGGAVSIVFGVTSTLVGISNLWFYQTEIEKDYKKLSEIDSSFRESSAMEYLRVKAHQAKQERQKNDVWNLFGLIPKPETQIEKEYREYIREHPEKDN